MTDETQPDQSPPLLFICYAHKDNEDSEFKQRCLDRLLQHLAPLEFDEEAIIWCDRELQIGDEWNPSILAALQSAKVAIALLSPAFFASSYIRTKEIPLILEQVDKGQTTLLPIMLSPCLVAESKFRYRDRNGEEQKRSLNDFQASNDMRRPLKGLPEHEQDAILLRVAQRAREIVTGKKPEVPNGGEQQNNTPNNLPRSATDTFVGRAEALIDIHNRLQAGQSVAICAVSGMGGIGKTELALQYAIGQLKTRSDLGAVCWFDARQDIGLQIVSFARSTLELALPELPDLKELAAWCWRRFPIQECLIVFDDVQDYQAIESFLPPVEARFKVLITTRENLEQDAVSVVAIETLKPLQAFELLYLTVNDESRFVQGQQIAEELCEWVGYLPLGIKLVAKFFKVERDLSIADLLSELKAEKLKHDGLTKIEIVFELSWEKLNEAERQLAMILGAFGKAAIVWEWVERSVEFCRVEAGAEPVEQWCLLLEPKAVRRGRRRLIELSLLQWVAAEQYQVHPLLREFFVGKMTQKEGRAIRTAVAMVMIEVAKKIPDTPTLEIIHAISAAIPHLQTVAEDLMQLRSREECGIEHDNELTWVFTGISRFYWGQGLYADAEPWFVARLKVAQLLLGAQHLDVASSLNNLAGFYLSQGRYSQAEPLYVQALEIQLSLSGDQYPNVAVTLNNLAELYRLQGRYEQAEPLYVQSLNFKRLHLGDRHPDVAFSLNNLALLYYSQGRYEQAEPLYVQALEIWQSLLENQYPQIAVTLSNLAAVYDSQGRYEQAEPLYVQALEIQRSLLGDQHPDLAVTLNNLALVYCSQGRYDQAELLYIQSLELKRLRLGDQHPDVASTLNNLALLYNSQGRHEQARLFYIQALEIWRSLLGDRHPEVAIGLGNLAELYQTLEQYTEAERLYLQALSIFYQQPGKAHHFTQNAFRAFVDFLYHVIQNDRTSELSDHPLTRSLLEQLQSASDE